MYAATNEIGGTSYGSRLSDKKFMFAGKTGSSQIKNLHSFNLRDGGQTKRFRL